MDDFQWQTDEDWHEEPLPVDAADAPSRWRRRGRIVLTVLLITSLLAGSLSGLRRRVNTGLETVEADVRQSMALLDRAIAARDVELYSLNLSGVDRGWTVTQQQLLADGAVRERTNLGLAWLPERSRVVDISFSADLRQAEVTSHHQYAFEVAAGITDTVTLAHTDVLRQGSDRWLLAPPPSTFWGDALNNDGGVFPLVSYLESDRDIDVVPRLMRDLNAIYLRICVQRPGLRCFQSQPGIQGTIIFSRNPASLARQTTPLNFGRSLTVPTPSLAGRPTDERSYQALLRGYARLTLKPLIAQAAGYECCERADFADALIDWALAELGLAIWSIDQAGLETQPPSFDWVLAAWHAPNGAAPPQTVGVAPYLVDFLRSLHLEGDPIALLGRLHEPELRLPEAVALLGGSEATRPTVTRPAADGSARLAPSLASAWKAHWRTPPNDTTCRDQTPAAACKDAGWTELATTNIAAARSGH